MALVQLYTHESGSISSLSCLLERIVTVIHYDNLKGSLGMASMHVVTTVRNGRC